MPEPSPVRPTSTPASARDDASREPARANGSGPSEAESHAPAATETRKTLIVPVAGVEPSRVRDTFRASRGTRQHNALDIMAPRGTPVLAADDGRILRLSRNPAGGITIYQHSADSQYVYYYAHLQGYRKGLAVGDVVRKGDVIAYVGTTGNAPDNLPHLHFQVMRYRPGRYWDGEPVNAHGWLVRQSPFLIINK
ncbi:MAG TPA: M23 family metallopeptidase [Gemmatimonadaceae bacterium]